MTILGLQRFDLPYKDYGSAKFSIYSNNNSKIIILLPGQTLPPEMFFGLPVFSNGDSVIDKLLVGGYDVGCLDPIMYGNSQGEILDLYTRQDVANQLISAIEHVENDYDKVFLQGYSTTSPVPFIAASKKSVAGIVSMGPVLPENNNVAEKFLKERRSDTRYMTNSLDIMKSVRFKTVSDIMPGHSEKVTNWDELFLKKLSTFKNFNPPSWHGPDDIVNDIAVYYTMNKNHGWSMKDVTCPVVILKGSHDTECADLPDTPYFGVFSNFVNYVKPNLKEIIIVDTATHFGMWEQCHEDWTNRLIYALDSMS